jgi:hypothetical protein
MTPSEIIRKDAERLGYDADAVMRKIAKVVKVGAGLLLREGDTLLLLIALPKNAAEAHLYTADSGLRLLGALKSVIKKVQDSDLSAIYSSFDAPEIINMIDDAGIDVQKSDLPNYRWMAILQ